MGCQELDTVTYPNPKVEEVLSAQFVPCRMESGKAPEVAKRFNVRWLPALVVVDDDERPVHQITGFLPPEELLSELTFAQAIRAMAHKRYDEAHALFAQAAKVPTERACEALFWWGVSRFRQSKEFASAIREPWGELLARFPSSQWAHKVRYALRNTGAIPS